MPVYRIVRSTTKLESFVVEASSEAEAIDKCSGPGMLVGSASIYDVSVEEDVRPVKLMPHGFGFYLRRISGGVESAKQLLQRCLDADARWVSFMVEASDGYKVPLDTVKLYADVLASDMSLWVWTFPGEARAASVEASADAARLALSYCDQISADGVMLDIEAPYKNKSESLQSLISTTRSGLSFGTTLGVVSYPIPSMQPTIDWKLFKQADWGSPMLYNTAGTVEGVNKSIAEWSPLVPAIIPSMATYDTSSPGTGAEQLHGDIERVLGSAPPMFDGAIMWSEQSTDAAERVVMREASKAYGW
jgi:hypothetical protein